MDKRGGKMGTRRLEPILEQDKGRLSENGIRE